MSALAAIEAQLVTIFGAVAGIANAVGHEPGQAGLPPRPCVTLLYSGLIADDQETGPLEDVTHRWTLNLYLDLRDFEKTQATYKQLLPLLYEALRADPRLNNLVDRAWMSDEGRDPEFVKEEGSGALFVKAIGVRAKLTE